jgi:16S rRNA (adenine1518-N6/adenine1519-N6)-dimethyltransferase
MADALESDFEALTQHRQFSLVSNLPYEISTPLLFKLVNYANQVQEVVLLLQQEVVQRMCASVGSSHYGRLSVMAQYHFKCEALLEVNPEAFSPPPKVMSQVVRLKPIDRDDSINMKDFECFVKTLFLHRRKMIRQQFKLIPQDAWQSIDIEPTQRPQALSVAAVIKLFKLCVQYNCLPKC